MRLETEAACSLFAALYMRTMNVRQNESKPRGCYVDSSINVLFFNKALVGAADSTSQLVCAAATAGARLQQQVRPPGEECVLVCSPLHNTEWRTSDYSTVLKGSGTRSTPRG